MKTKSLYISAQERGAGTLFVTMGMMEILKKNIDRVAFFRPIISSKDVVDGDIEFIINRYKLDMRYEDCYGFDISYIEAMIASNSTHDLIDQLIVKFKKLEKEYDFVLCEGIRHSFLTSTINYDINILIAQNFASSYINIISAKNRTIKDIYEDVLIGNENAISQGCSHFATFINRLDDNSYKELENKLENYKLKTYLLREIEDLNLLNIQDVIDSLGAKTIVLGDEDHTRIIRNVKVAALSLDNFLDHIEENDLVIVPADRSDIILGLLGSLYSSSYPNISGIIFTFGLQVHPNIAKLFQGLTGFSIPMLAVQEDTYKTAKIISNTHSRLRPNSHRKIALAHGLFNSSVDMIDIESRIANASSDIMTPIMFEYKLFDTASTNKKRIVLPESNDERILRSAEIVLRRGFAEIILIGNEDELKENYLRYGIDLSDATIVDHNDSKYRKEFVDKFYEMRKHKGLTYEASEDAMTKVNYFATMMVHLGYADGMVSGASHSTGDTIRPALQIIKTTPDVSTVSSVFFMCLNTKVLVYGDCAVNQDPDAQTLADIAITSAKTATSFGIEPKIAMLSYSTGDSGTGVDVDKVREATKIVKERNPELLIEGPIQYDAAVNKNVARKKLPNSKVAGEATLFIFPDLNTGNNTYKAVQRSSDAIAIGPILQGLNKPINDLSRGCLIADIVNTIAITAIQAGQK